MVGIDFLKFNLYLLIFNFYFILELCFSGGSVVKNLPANAGDGRFHPWVRKILWKRKWQPTPVFLTGEFHAQRSVVGYSPWGRKSQTWLSDSTTTYMFKGLPRWLSGEESTCQSRRCKKWGFYSWLGKIPWSRKWQPTPVFLPGKFHGQSSLAGYSPWGHKELDTTEWLSAHMLVQNSVPNIKYLKP